MKMFLAVLAQTIDFGLVGGNDDDGNGKCKKNNDDIVWKRMSIIPTPANGVLVHVHPATTATVPEETKELSYDSKKLCIVERRGFYFLIDLLMST
mmetsp:Transcript_32626/g.37027  ORF Transcript_32626/g.37027 Transcript_32626/m.37027 type:complete len:95 (+) Transcript_32626:700-984(+)